MPETVSLRRIGGFKRLRITNIVTNQEIKSFGWNKDGVGFDVEMPDNSQMHIRLSNDAIVTMAKKIGLVK
jgi:hypothetical protein